MRVLLLGNHWTAGPGGAETVLALTGELLGAAGHDVVPLGLAEPGTLPTPAADLLPVRPPSRTSVGEAWRGTWSWTAWRAVDTAVRRFRPQVAHVHHVYEGLTLAVLDVLRRRGVPTVMTVHDYRPVCPGFRLLPAGVQGPPATRCLHAGPARVLAEPCLEGSRWRSVGALAEAVAARRLGWYDHVTAFLCPSRFLADRLVEGGLDRGRVRVVPNPVVVPGPDDRAAPAIPPYAAFTGRLTPEKGVHVLLDAAGSLPSGARLVVLGSGRSAADVARRVREERLPVDLLGAGTPTDAAAVLRGATVAVLPALWWENCPMAVLESAALGVPVVATRMGGIPELVDDGRTGLLVPPGDPAALAAALSDLLLDPGRAATLGGAARERVAARHDPAGYVATVEDAYASAVRSAERAAR